MEAARVVATTIAESSNRVILPSETLLLDLTHTAIEYVLHKVPFFFEAFWSDCVWHALTQFAAEVRRYAKLLG